MDRLNLLGVALGLAALAGINLYLTVFVTGLAIHFHWIAVAPRSRRGLRLRYELSAQLDYVRSYRWPERVRFRVVYE